MSARFWSCPDWLSDKKITAQKKVTTMRAKTIALLGTVASAMGVCGMAMADEPSEAQMKEAALYAINHPPGIVNSEPITIKFFKKEACDAPTPRGYNCGFDWQVA